MREIVDWWSLTTRGTDGYQRRHIGRDSDLKIYFCVKSESSRHGTLPRAWRSDIASFLKTCLDLPSSAIDPKTNISSRRRTLIFPIIFYSSCVNHVTEGGIKMIKLRLEKSGETNWLLWQKSSEDEAGQGVWETSKLVKDRDTVRDHEKSMIPSSWIFLEG